MKIFRYRALLAVLAVGACAPAMAQVSDAQRSAIKSACRGDYMKVCSSVPTGTQASLQCLEQHSAQVSPGCQSALAAVTPAAAPVAAPAMAAAVTPAPVPAAAVPAAAAGMPMTQGEKARLLRRDCAPDFERLCAGLGVGGGRGAACLKGHAAELTPICRTALMSVAPH
ncbi:MAG: hypothetical protein JSR36_05825 [Proteobacteria bacterium]|nr:hypothetical protein [Pseudomonadota bacterium]